MQRSFGSSEACAPHTAHFAALNEPHLARCGTNIGHAAKSRSVRQANTAEFPSFAATAGTHRRRSIGRSRAPAARGSEKAPPGQFAKGRRRTSRALRLRGAPDGKPQEPPAPRRRRLRLPAVFGGNPPLRRLAAARLRPLRERLFSKRRFASGCLLFLEENLETLQIVLEFASRIGSESRRFEASGGQQQSHGKQQVQQAH